MDEEKVVIARPQWKNRRFALVFFSVLIAALIGFAIWFCHSPNPALHTSDFPPPIAIPLFGAVFFLSLFVSMDVWVKRSQVIAEPSGLRWWKLGRWHHIEWDQVTDYYFEMMPTFERTVYLTCVKTTSESVKISDEWTNGGALRDYIREHATNSVANTWAVLGARPRDYVWPRVFEYSLLRIFAQSFGLILFGFAYILFCLHLSSGWFVDAFVISYVLTIIIQSVVVFLYALRHCRGQKITVDLESITFEDDNRKTRFAWSEIKNTHFTHIPGWLAVPGRYVLVAENGKIDYTYFLQNASILTAIINTHATEVQKPRWSDPDDLNTVYDKLPHSREDDPTVGTCVYHFRTRATRALLWLLGTCFVASVITQLLVSVTAIEPLSAFALTWNWTWIVTLGLAFIWSLWRYRSASIITTDEAIIQKTPFGSVTIPWSDIKRRYLRGKGLIAIGNIIGSQKRIRFLRHVSNFQRLEACLYLRSRQIK